MNFNVNTCWSAQGAYYGIVCVLYTIVATDDGLLKVNLIRVHVGVAFGSLIYTSQQVNFSKLLPGILQL